MEEKKLSYDELKNTVSQLSAQNESLKKQLNNMNYSNAFTRLDFLFKVLANASMFPRDFIDKSVGEIIVMMTIPEETKTNEEA